MTAGPSIVIADEPFKVEVVDGRILITHEHWSIEGVGESLADALVNLIEHARIIAPHYTRFENLDCTPSARRLGQFVERLLKIKR